MLSCLWTFDCQDPAPIIVHVSTFSIKAPNHVLLPSFFFVFELRSATHLHPASHLPNHTRNHSPQQAWAARRHALPGAPPIIMTIRSGLCHHTDAIGTMMRNQWRVVVNRQRWGRGSQSFMNIKTWADLPGILEEGKNKGRGVENGNMMSTTR